MPRVVFKRLENLYARMTESYQAISREMGFSCSGCPDNCCTSYFQHHTRVEWAYFMKGLERAPAETREKIYARAEKYVQASRWMLDRGQKPDLMCPVNENGLCLLYHSRLMICRLHGVPTLHIRPDGQKLEFPGCFRAREKYQHIHDCPRLDRTEFYRELAGLEQAFVGPAIKNMPRVNLTLAEMIVQGQKQASHPGAPGTRPAGSNMCF